MFCETWPGLFWGWEDHPRTPTRDGIIPFPIFDFLLASLPAIRAQRKLDMYEATSLGSAFSGLDQPKREAILNSIVNTAYPEG